MKIRAIEITQGIAVTAMLTVAATAVLNGCESSKNSTNPRSSFAATTLQDSDLQNVKALLHELSKPTGKPAQPPSGEFAQSLAALHARIGDPDTAFRITAGIQSVQGRMQSYIKTGEACAVIGDMNCIEGVLKQIEDDDLAAKIQNPFTGSLAKQGRISALTVILTAQAKKGDIQHAEETFSRIDFATLHPELAEQSQRGLSKELALAYVQCRDAKAALKTVEAIKKASSRDHALADIAIALADVGETQGARQAVEMLRKNKPGSHLAPRIVEALVKAGDKEGAMDFLQPLLQSALAAHNDWAIGDYAAAQAILDPIGAQKTALTLPEKSGATGYSRRDATLASVARIQAQSNDISGALETINLIHDGKTQNETSSSIAEELVKKHELRRALEVAMAINHPYWKHTLAKVQALMGDVPGAMRLAISLPQSFDKSQALSGIVEAQISTNALKDAVQTAGFIDQDNIKDRTYTELARAHAKAGQLATAITLVDQVMWQRRAEVTRQIGLEYASAGRWNEAWKIPQESSRLNGTDSLMLGLVEGMFEYRAGHKEHTGVLNSKK